LTNRPRPGDMESMTDVTQHYVSNLETLYSYLRGLQEDGPRYLDVRRDTLALLSLARNIPPPVQLAPSPGDITAKAASIVTESSLMQWVCERVPQPGDPASAPWIRMAGMPVDFEGASLTLLTKMVAAIGYRGMADPSSFQADGTFKGLTVVLGEEALAEIMGRKGLLLKMRGRRADSPQGVLFPTSHIGALHDSIPGKKKVWEELRSLMSLLGLSLPKTP